MVTAAGSGIGAATAALFAAEGAAVVVADIDGDAAGRVVAEITGAGGTAVAAACDVASADDVARTVRAAVDGFGGVDVLVSNAAGGGGAGPLELVPEAEFGAAFDVNVKGGFLLAKEVIPGMRRAGRGAILFTSSLGARLGTENMAVYGATKAALVSLVKSMALELGRHGIRVNAVCPGAVLTPGLLRRDVPLEALAARVPLGRLGRPEEIAQAFLFLASDAAGYVTGQALEVDGGMGAGAMAPRPPTG